MTDKLEKIYGGINDISEYISFRVGERFIVVKDTLCKYVGLYDRLFLDYPIMSNSTHEKISNLEIIEKAQGDVLIGGFGIGLIVLPLLNKKEVDSIEIVELHSEVIDLVSTQLPLTDKVKIINDNIYTFNPVRKYDTIYIDTVSDSWNTEDEKKQRVVNGEMMADNHLADIYMEHLNIGGFCSYFKPHINK